MSGGATSLKARRAMPPAWASSISKLAEVAGLVEDPPRVAAVELELPLDLVAGEEEAMASLSSALCARQMAHS
jgi:hypothetical protein